jgi:hypothetical protein
MTLQAALSVQEDSLILADSHTDKYLQFLKFKICILFIAQSLSTE